MKSVLGDIWLEPTVERVGHTIGDAMPEVFTPLVPRNRTTALQAYRNDPIAFTRDCIAWPERKALASYQEEILDALAHKHRAAARGPHGLGKTTTAALAVLWFALTRDAAGEDWKVPTTAGAWRQLTKYLWPEIHKWARRIRWEKVGREPFTTGELLTLSLRLNHGEAFAVASNSAELIEGAHADCLLYLFDESKAISETTFDAAEGAFSGAGADTGQEALALAISTPGEPQGRFYDIHRRKPGFEDWFARHVTLDEAIAAKRISMEWAEQRRRQWGEKSAVYQNRVLGEFASSEADGVIPLSWVELANERWRERVESGEIPELTRIAIDVARGGADKTVLGRRHGDHVAHLERYSYDDTMQTTGIAAGIMRVHGNVDCVVDVIGVGAGVYDRLREQFKQRAKPFNASEHSTATDRSHELGFVNRRSEGWWRLREALDPSFTPTLELPPDDELTGDLTAPRWKVASNGKISVESKDELRKAERLGRSTDVGDAVMQLLIEGTVVVIVAAPDTGGSSYWAPIM